MIREEDGQPPQGLQQPGPRRMQRRNAQADLLDGLNAVELAELAVLGHNAVMIERHPVAGDEREPEAAPENPERGSKRPRVA